MDCLDTPVILRHTLQQFSNKEIIQLSLVNKQWNYEARCVLRNRGTLIAGISSGSFRNGDLVAFASDVEKMRVVPFSGIRVTLFHDQGQICRSASDASYKAILERLPMKKLSAEFPVDWDQCTGDCPAFLLLKKILEKFSGVLEELSLTFNWVRVATVPDCFINCSFPCLKTLKLDPRKTNEDFQRVVKKLVSCAPNLQELKMVGKICFDEDVLKGSSAVLIPGSGFNPLYERVCKNLVRALRPESMEICQQGQGDGFNEELLNRDVPTVLQVSFATLTTFKMDLLFAVPLICYGICLENVTTLGIRLNGQVLESHEPRFLTLLKRFDFTRFFPKVTKVKIEGNLYETFSAGKVDAFVEQGIALLQETLGDRAINIQQLTLRDCILDSSVPLLAQMFPDVKTLSVKTRGNNLPTLFTSLWDHFKFLQELKLKSSRIWGGVTNLDSVFCGIFPEEVAELREKDDEYLKAVNIVPVMPSITCLKDLRTFTFRYIPKHFYPTPGAGLDWSDFWFSKVTGFVGFTRCPDLTVTFQTRSWQCAEALRHMEPFATFVELD